MRIDSSDREATYYSDQPLSGDEALFAEALLNGGIIRRVNRMLADTVRYMAEAGERLEDAVLAVEWDGQDNVLTVRGDVLRSEPRRIEQGELTKEVEAL